MLAVAMAAALLAGCSAKKEKLPEPQELFETIQQEVELPEMVDLAEELLLDSTGISEDSFGRRGQVRTRLSLSRQRTKMRP